MSSIGSWGGEGVRFQVSGIRKQERHVARGRRGRWMWKMRKLPPKKQKLGGEGVRKQEYHAAGRERCQERSRGLA
jgi:hypothetical protein